MTNLKSLDMDYFKRIAARVNQEKIEKARVKRQTRNIVDGLVSKAIADKNNNQVVTRDENPAQVTPTNEWLYVPSIGMEFAPSLDGLGKNWYDCHKLVKSKGLIMPSIEETWALFFEAKNNLSKPEFRKIYEYFTKKTPVNTWQGEWQDASFVEKKGKMYMHRLKEFKGAKDDVILYPGVDITGSYLAQDGYASITQKSNITSEGMLNVADSRNSYVEGENFYSWYPRNGAVARFYANSGRAFLSCVGNPTGTISGLGVRFARRVGKNITKGATQ